MSLWSRLSGTASEDAKQSVLARDVPVDGIQYRYWAFISYSHRDKKWGDWLHKAMEEYTVSDDIAAAYAGERQLPKRIFPVFRDRDELPTSHDLGENIKQGLTDSEYLIVICSPNAVGSMWVNEEIKTFKALGRENKVLCLIVDGEPNASSKSNVSQKAPWRDKFLHKVGLLSFDDCFPESVRFKVNRNKEITLEHTEPIAADARPGQGGKLMALVKLAAGVLQIDFDKLWKRELRRNRRNQIGSILTMAALSMVFAGLAWEAAKQRDHAEYQAKTAFSRFLVTQSNEILNGGSVYPLSLGSLLAIEAYAISPDVATLGALIRARRLNEFQSAVLMTVGGVSTVAFSPDGGTLASGNSDEDEAVWLWDTASREPLGRPLYGHKHGVTAVAFSPDGKTLASAARANSTVNLWKVAGGEPLGQLLYGHRDGVTAVAFSPDGKTLASASDDKTVRLWDAASEKPLGEPLRGHKSWVSSVAFSPDGKTLAAGNRLWDTGSRRPLGEPLPHEYLVSSVAFSPDGKTLATGSGDTTVRLWDVTSRKSIGEPLRGHEDVVHSVVFSLDGKILATGSYDKTVRLWDMATSEPIGEPLRGHDGHVDSIAFSPDGETLATGSKDKTVRLWEMASRKPLGEPLRGHKVSVWSVAFSPDGKTLATANMDNTVRLWDTASRKPIGEPLRGHEGWVSTVSFSMDGKILVTGSDDETARLWDVASRKPIGEPLRVDGLFNNFAYSVALSPDGKTLATAGQQNTLRLWDMTSRKLLSEPMPGYDESPQLMRSVAFSPDGKTLATGGDDNIVQLWDTATRKHSDDKVDQSNVTKSGFVRGGSSSMRGHDSWVMSVAFSPNGKTLATGSNDKTVRLWDVASRKSIGEPLRGHADAVYSVVFSPDGKTLATGGADETVRLWDVAGRKPIGEPLHVHASEVRSVAFSPDGKILVSGGADKIILWDTNFASYPAHLCQRLHRNLTLAEWAEFIGDFLPYRKTCPNLPEPADAKEAK